MTDEHYEPYGGDERLERIASKAMELCVNIGLFETIAGHWPEHVHANWEERKGAIADILQEQINEVLQFAEAYDQ